METIKILFVCMGNICRSPTAEGVFTKLVNDRKLTTHFQIDSAGTHDYHIGKAPDERAQLAARGRGVEINSLRARQIHGSDFDYFDHILVMDDENYGNLMAICPPEFRYKVKHFLEYATHFSETEVPDPYFGGNAGFERVLNMVEDASAGLLDSLKTLGKLNSVA